MCWRTIRLPAGDTVIRWLENRGGENRSPGQLLLNGSHADPDVLPRELSFGLEKHKSARVGLDINSIRQSRLAILVFGPWLVVDVNWRSFPLNL